MRVVGASSRIQRRPLDRASRDAGEAGLGSMEAALSRESGAVTGSCAAGWLAQPTLSKAAARTAPQSTDDRAVHRCADLELGGGHLVNIGCSPWWVRPTLEHVAHHRVLLIRRARRAAQAL